MDEKKLEILIVEDGERHLADAKLALETAEVNITYAVDLREAQKEMTKQQFDGIISDVFFPYDHTQGNHITVFGKEYRRSTTQGWDQLGKVQCLEALSAHIPEYHTSVSDAWDRWLAGKEMHPSGAVVAEQALKDGTPIVFCSDTFHHNASAEPVCQYARANGITYVDKIDNGKKDWVGALKCLEATQQLHLNLKNNEVK
jgi:CheY-like chemotaxis protein